MGKKWMTVAATAAAAITIAGCGGSSGDSDETTTTSAAASAVAKAEFRQNIARICARVNEAIGQTREDLQTVESNRRWAKARRAAQINALESLDEADAPDFAQAKFALWRNLLEQFSIASQDAQVQILTRDPEIRATFTTINAIQPQLLKLQKELGLDTCF